MAGPTRPRLKEGATARSDSRGLRGGTSSGRYVWISSNLLVVKWGLSNDGWVLGPPAVEKLPKTTKYLNVRQNQGIAWSSDSNL